MAETQRLLTGRSSEFFDNPRYKYLFGRSAGVPGGGTLQLFAVGQTLTGFRVVRPGLITALSLHTNVGDAVRSYSLQVFINGVLSTAVLAFPAGGGNSQQTVALATAVVAGDIITVFLVRTAGAGASTFGDEEALVEITERP